MSISDLVVRGKKNDITSLNAERINQNFDQLFTDVRAAVVALKGLDVATLTATVQAAVVSAQAAAAAALAALQSAAVAYPIDAGVCEGRLTLTSGTPITMADVTGATSVYWTPYRGRYVGLYDGALWALVPFVETTLALGTVTSGLPYDVFAYNNAGTLALEKLAWTNGTTRATALVLQDGVWVKAGATTRRYLGSFYTTGTTTTEDSSAKRFLWNMYGRDRRPLLRQETTGTWTYTTATLRQANNSAANQVSVFIGLPESTLALALTVIATNSAGGPNISVQIGEDSTTVAATGCIGGLVPTSALAGACVTLLCLLTKKPALGLHTYPWLEYSTVGGTTTFFGAAITGGSPSGLSGSVDA